VLSAFVYLKVSFPFDQARVKWKDAKRKIIILQFLIKWQWKLLAGVVVLVVCLLPVAVMQNLSCWKQKLIMSDQNR